MKLLPFIIYFYLASLLSAQTRSWTNYLGKTIEAGFVSSDGKKVTLQLPSGRKYVVACEVLSAADRQWIQQRRAQELKAQKGSSKKGHSAMVPRILRGKLVKYKGNRFVKCDANYDADLYLIYIASSVSGPGKTSGRELSSLYENRISKNPEVEMIHISADDDSRGMRRFFRSHQASFPSVTYNRRKSMKALTKYSDGTLPNYLLLDREGQVLAKGKEDVLSLVEEKISRTADRGSIEQPAA